MRKLQAFVVAAVLAAFTMVPGVSSTSSNINQEAYAECSRYECNFVGCTSGTIKPCTLYMCDDGEYIECFYYFDHM